MRLAKLVDKVKKSNLALIIGVVLFLITAGITILNGYIIVKSSYEQTIGQKNILLKSLSLLSGDVDINYFDTVLGSPVFKNVRQDDFLEYIYVNPHYYVQAVTNTTGKVIFYSVTTRDANFNPEVSFGGWDEENNRQKTVILGKTKFSELGNQPAVYASYPGVHNHFYSEGYWTGNPGGYRSYFFSINDSGYTSEPAFLKHIPFVLASTTDFGKEDAISDLDLLNYRDTATINTYTVTAPMVLINEIGEIEPPDGLLGPNLNQVRVLDWH